MTIVSNPNLLFTVRQLCNCFGVSADWVYHRTRARSKARLPVVRLGRLVRFDPEEIRRYVERFRIDGRGSLSEGNQSALTTKGGLRMKRVVQGYQRGCLRVRNGCFELLYRECIVGSDGRIHRPRRTVRLGPEEIGTREAERLRDEVLPKINNQREARREITFGEFVNGPFFETKLPALSKNCQDNYRHLLSITTLSI